MEVIIVLAIAGVVLALLVVGLGSMIRGPRGDGDELVTERGADEGPEEGMGSDPTRDRPAGPGAEPQDPESAQGELHPPEQRGSDPGDVAPPSEAAGKREHPREDGP